MRVAPHAALASAPMAKRILLTLLVMLAAVQFIRPTKNLSAEPPGPDDFLVRHAPPPEIKHLFQVACYDCHSNQTRYPWYAEIQPIGWYLADHVKHGKAELNLSEFGTLSRRDQKGALDEMIDEIETRHMPLKSYTYTHRDAVLTDAQIAQVVAWLEDIRDELDAKEP
jgi:hypothetical protein